MMKKTLTTLPVLLAITLNLYAQDAREYFKYAKYQYDNFEYTESLEFINKAIKLDSSYLNAYFLRAQIYQELGQYYSSVLDIDRILKADRSETNFTGQCHLVRGRCYMALEKYSRAKEDFDIALRYTKDDPEVLYYQAKLSLNAEDPDRALKYVEQAIRKKEDAAYFGLKAEIKMKKFGDSPESSQYRSIHNDINTAIALDGDNYEFYLIRSTYLKSLGNSDDALTDYDRMIELSPNKDVAYANRGIAKLNNYDYSGAILDLSESIMINPANPETYRYRGLCYNNLNNYNKAYQDFTKSIDILTARFTSLSDKEAAKKQLAETYLMRGHSQNLVGSEIEACRDFLRAYQLGVDKGLNYYRKFCSIY